jgi:tRNA pseudouridine55 synthase
MNGFINLHKSFGLTSHDCVAQVRKILRTKRVGHGGTLDPAATGVLPIAIGRAPRLLQYLSHEKAYRGTIRFGVRTDTDDLQGTVLATTPCDDLNLEAIKAVLPQFIGTLQQIPPSYSAIQVGGKRLYDLARAGELVEAPVRTVVVHDLEILAWRSPDLEVAIRCGTGTYIRAIARDLGDVLQVGGTLAALERTHSSGFDLADSILLENLAAQVEAHTFMPHPPEFALRHLPQLTLPGELAQRWCHGQKIEWGGDWGGETQQEGINANAPGIYQIFHEDGIFLGIGEQRSQDDMPRSLLAPKLVWAD